MKRRDFVAGSAALLSGISLRGNAGPCPPPQMLMDGTASAVSNCSSAEQDWLARTSGPGVVWFHDFRSDAEVSAFRFSGNVGGGNDPNAVGYRASDVRRITSDGVTGGGCLEMVRRAGTSECAAAWWRMFNPISASGNGREQDDPGASGSVPLASYAATQGGNQIYDWIYGARPGWYGHPSYHTGTAFDGSEFFLQMRVKMDPRRTASGNSQVGKLFYLTTTRYSNTSQEVVTYSGAFSSANGPNYHRMYAVNYNPIEDSDSLRRPGQQVGSILADYAAGEYCDIGDAGRRGYCWTYSGGWDTLLYHVTPGRAGVQETILRVYAAHEGETSYTRIWDITYATPFDQGAGFRNGWNALILSTYNNGLNNSEFWHRYDQLVFSKQFIPCPQV